MDSIPDNAAPAIRRYICSGQSYMTPCCHYYCLLLLASPYAVHLLSTHQNSNVR